MSYNSIGAYRRTQVETARPEEVLLQLMEKAVRHARQGQARGEAKDPVGAREHAVRLLNIVTELDGSLDREQGGELVEELQALYAYLIREISEGNRKGEFERLADVESVLRTLYQGWKNAVAELQEQAGDNAAPAAAGQSV